MLKKLYKYEWKSVWLLLAILHGILIVYTLIGRIGLEITLSRINGYVSLGTAHILNTIFGFYILVYVLFIFGIVIATFVYLTVRVQKSLFSDEGYLTHTLPVSSHQLLWSKVLISWTWLLIDLVCVVFSVLVLLSHQKTIGRIQEIFSDLCKVLGGSYGFQDMLTSWLTILGAIVKYFGFYIFLVICSLCIGSLFKTHKILGAVLSFFGINILLSFFSGIIAMVIPQGNSFYFFFGISVSVTSTQGMSSIGDAIGVMVFSLIWDLIWMAVFYFISHSILTKKLNLE